MGWPLLPPTLWLFMLDWLVASHGIGWRFRSLNAFLTWMGYPCILHVVISTKCIHVVATSVCLLYVISGWSVSRTKQVKLIFIPLIPLIFRPELTHLPLFILVGLVVCLLFGIGRWLWDGYWMTFPPSFGSLKAFFSWGLLINEWDTHVPFMWWGLPTASE